MDQAEGQVALFLQGPLVLNKAEERHINKFMAQWMLAPNIRATSWKNSRVHKDHFNHIMINPNS